MNFLIALFNYIKKGFSQTMNNFDKNRFTSKPQRPMIQKIWIAEVVDGEVVIHDRWIIVNYKGETLEAPIFDNEKAALDWLDEHHPAQNYAPQ